MNSKKLVLNVVADTKQAVAGLGEVSQGIKDLFKLQQGSGRDIATGALKAFDGLHGALQGVMPVATAVLDIAEKGIEMAQFAGQRQLLLRQVGDENLAALHASTQGLVDDQTLLQAAAKGLRGDFALTTEQMQEVAAAAVTLHNEGFGPVSEIIQDLTEKLAGGEVDGLKKYGINLAMASTQAQKLGLAHEAMGRLAHDANNKLTDSGTEATQLLVHMKNIWDDLKMALGEVAGAFAWVTNGIIDATSAVGDSIGLLAACVLSWGEVDDIENQVWTTTRGVMNAQQEADEAQRKHNESIAIAIDFAHRLSAEYLHVRESLRLLAGDETAFEAQKRRFAQMVELNKLAEAADEERAAAAKKALEKEEKDWKDFTASLDKVMDHRLALVKTYEDAERRSEETIIDLWQKAFDEKVAKMKADRDEIQSIFPIANENRVDPGIARLQSMARASMDAKRAMEALKSSGLDAFGSLTSAAGTSLQAILSGNKAAHASMGEVFKQLLDQLGTEMQINALKYLAMGTAAVFLDPAAAGGYFAAAGIFEAAALAAGVAERAVGAPAGQAAATGGGSSSGSANDNTAGRDAGSSGGGGNTTVIHQYYVNGYIGDEAQLARKMENARRKSELSGQVRVFRGAQRG